MLGAVVVTFLGYRIAFRRPRPVLVERFSLPTAKNVDGRVVFGAALFGVGWGLSGFCPGPAIHLIFIAGKGHAHLRARDAHWHRLGASSDTDEAVQQSHLSECD